MNQLRLDDQPPTQSKIVRVSEDGRKGGAKTSTPCGCVQCPPGTLHDTVYEVTGHGLLYCAQHLEGELRSIQRRRA